MVPLNLPSLLLKYQWLKQLINLFIFNLKLINSFHKLRYLQAKWPHTETQIIFYIHIYMYLYLYIYICTHNYILKNSLQLFSDLHIHVCLLHKYINKLNKKLKISNNSAMRPSTAKPHMAHMCNFVDLELLILSICLLMHHFCIFRVTS